MSKVMTVCGPIDVEALGLTTMHDHVLSILDPFFQSKLSKDEEQALPIEINKPFALEDLFYLNQLGMRVYSKENWDLTDAASMQQEVSYFKQRGGQTILETSAPGIRGDVEALRDISQATGVHIIASTGLYVGVSWPKHYVSMENEAYKDYLRQELDVGINGTSIRAGHIKSAIRTGEDGELKFFKASAEISREKNVLLTAHTSRGTDPANRRKMLHLLLDSGINPDKLLLCHIHFTFWEGDFVSHFIDPSKQCLRLEWAKEVMDHGVNVSVDCFGEQPGPWDSVRLAGLITLLQEGYEDRIVIGNDVYMKAMTRSGGGFGYCGILDYVIPQLKQHGISDQTIEKITVLNPRRMLPSN